MLKDKNFYNQESTRYSSKRYPSVAENYVQYFFKKRLALVLSILEENFKHQAGLSLLEIGCADGVVLREISEKQSNIFSKLIGIDTSDGMISEAKVITVDDKINYFVRGEEPLNIKYDVVLEVGVANYANIDEELIYAKNNLKTDGIYILSLAGQGSINAFWGKGAGYNNFLSYQDYEKKIKQYFEIKKIIPVGLFVPLIWKNKKLGYFVQNVFEKMFRLFPGLYHEKIFLLKDRKITK